VTATPGARSRRADQQRARLGVKGAVDLAEQEILEAGHVRRGAAALDQGMQRLRGIVLLPEEPAVDAREEPAPQAEHHEAQCAGQQQQHAARPGHQPRERLIPVQEEQGRQRGERYYRSQQHRVPCQRIAHGLADDQPNVERVLNEDRIRRRRRDRQRPRVHDDLQPAEYGRRGQDRVRRRPEGHQDHGHEHGRAPDDQPGEEQPHPAPLVGLCSARLPHQEGEGRKHQHEQRRLVQRVVLVPAERGQRHQERGPPPAHQREAVNQVHEEKDRAADEGYSRRRARHLASPARGRKTRKVIHEQPQDVGHECLDLQVSQEQERGGGGGERNGQPQEEPVGELGGDEEKEQRQSARPAVLAPAEREAGGAGGEDEHVGEVDEIACRARSRQRAAEGEAEQAEPDLEGGDAADDPEPAGKRHRPRQPSLARLRIGRVAGRTGRSARSRNRTCCARTRRDRGAGCRSACAPDR
jgi:hypothetical protein